MTTSVRSDEESSVSESRRAAAGLVPRPLPNETIYSACARFHELAAYGRPALAGQLLFDSEKASRRRCVPIGLSNLVETIYPAFANAMTVLREHTVGALYLRFMSPEQVDRALSFASGIPSSRSRYGFGWGSILFEKEHPLQSCSRCQLEAIESKGFSYWQVDHQLPGVLWCVLHGLPLQFVATPRSSAWLTPRDSVLIERNIDGRSEQAAVSLAKAAVALRGNVPFDHLAARAGITLELEQAGVVRAARAIDRRAVSRWVESKFSSLSGTSALLDRHIAAAPDVLSGNQVKHPLRWALLVASICMEGQEAARVLSVMDGPPQAHLPGVNPPTQASAPARAFDALADGTDWRDQSLQRPTVQRWLRDSELAALRKQSKSETKRSAHAVAVKSARSAGATSQKDFRTRCNAAVQWFKRNDPAWLMTEAPCFAPSTTTSQMELW